MYEPKIHFIFKPINDCSSYLLSCSTVHKADDIIEQLYVEFLTEVE